MRNTNEKMKWLLAGVIVTVTVLCLYAASRSDTPKAHKNYQLSTEQVQDIGNQVEVDRIAARSPGSREAVQYFREHGVSDEGIVRVDKAIDENRRLNNFLHEEGLSDEDVASLTTDKKREIFNAHRSGNRMSDADIMRVHQRAKEYNELRARGLPYETIDMLTDDQRSDCILDARRGDLRRLYLGH